MSGTKKGPKAAGRLGSLFFFLLSIWFYLHAWHTLLTIRQFPDVWFVHGLSPVLNAREAEAVLEREANEEQPCSLCFWSETEGAQVWCPGTGQTASLPLLLCMGDASLLDCQCYALPFQENGCWLDRDSALLLFGSCSVSGQELFADGKRYLVWGVLETRKPVMMARAYDSRENWNAEHLAIRSRRPIGRDGAGQVLLRAGLSGAEMIHYDPIYCIIYGLLLAAGLLFGNHVLYLAVWRIGACGFSDDPRSGGNGWFRTAVLWGIRILAAIVSGIVFIKQVPVPADYIPSVWSDAAFWLGRADDLATGFYSLFSGSKTGLEADLAEGLIQSLLLLSGSVTGSLVRNSCS